LANFDRKEHLQHRAVSLRQHGFLVKLRARTRQADGMTEELAGLTELHHWVIIITD